MVVVPEGAFMMGCNEEVDAECWDREHPYRSVDVLEFSVDVYEATVEIYAACVEADECSEPVSQTEDCNWDEQGRDDHPVNCVDWYQARDFCLWLGRRLCTEAEWEKAARGTDGRKYPWGNEPATCEHAIFNEGDEAGGPGCGTGSTWPVGSRPAGASPYGALDMLGNVWEWVEDDWHDTYDGAPDDGSAWVDEPRGEHRVGRGGGSQVQGELLRASYRYPGLPEYGSAHMGIRCCG